MFALVTLAALWAPFRPFAKMNLPGTFAIWLLAKWLERHPLATSDDGGETLVRVDLDLEPHARGVARDETLGDTDDYSNSRRSVASSRTPA